VRAKKELGQHFLVDENILGVIGRLAALRDEDVVLDLALSGFKVVCLLEHIQLNNQDLKAVNTKLDPEAVKPSAGKSEGKTALLEKHSWNVIRYEIR
jgi:alpha-L-arabinofuranosidase